MPTCQKCGFEYSEPSGCPICASARRRRDRRGKAVSASPRVAASSLRLILPVILAPALICASTWIYLSLPADKDAGRIAQSQVPLAAAAEPEPAVLQEAIESPSRPRVADALPADSEKDYIAWMLAHSDETLPFLERNGLVPKSSSDARTSPACPSSGPSSIRRASISLGPIIRRRHTTIRQFPSASARRSRVRTWSRT